jgi:hypothetical protein
MKKLKESPDNAVNVAKQWGQTKQKKLSSSGTFLSALSLSQWKNIKSTVIWNAQIV